MLTSSQLCKFLMKFESSYDSCYTYQVSCPWYNYFIEKLGEANLPYPLEYDDEIPPRNRVKLFSLITSEIFQLTH